MERNRRPLDDFMSYETDMERYLGQYGRHFSHKMYEFAVSQMYRVRDGKKERLQPLTREVFDGRMERTGLTLENDILYDGMYVMSMAESDFLGSSLPTRGICACSSGTMLTTPIKLTDSYSTGSSLAYASQGSLSTGTPCCDGQGIPAMPLRLEGARDARCH